MSSILSSHIIATRVTTVPLRRETVNGGSRHPAGTHEKREVMVGNFLTTAEVAEALRTPAETVRYWRHIGKGPASFKVGRRVLYDRSDVEAFIAKARSDARAARAC